MTLNSWDVYNGVPVQVKGLGPGYVVKVTRGARPYHVQTLAGGRYVCSLSHLEEIVSDETKNKAKEAYRASLLEEMDAFKELVLGGLVTLDKREGTYVVIGSVKNGKVRVALLGGDNNRYVTAPVGMVKKINIKDVEVVRA